MTPTEALRRARATMECGGAGAETCPLGMDAELEWAWLTARDGIAVDTTLVHPWFASALLDGYSVHEITKAGG